MLKSNVCKQQYTTERILGIGLQRVWDERITLSPSFHSYEFLGEKKKKLHLRAAPFKKGPIVHERQKKPQYEEGGTHSSIWILEMVFLKCSLPNL